MMFTDTTLDTFFSNVQEYEDCLKDRKFSYVIKCSESGAILISSVLLLRPIPTGGQNKRVEICGYIAEFSIYQRLNLARRSSSLDL